MKIMIDDLCTLRWRTFQAPFPDQCVVYLQSVTQVNKTFNLLNKAAWKYHVIVVDYLIDFIASINCLLLG